MSSPTSRWLIIASLSAWITSMGSSMVTMCTSRRSLMWSIMPASVVVLPRPGRPGDEHEPARLERELADRPAAGRGPRAGWRPGAPGARPCPTLPAAAEGVDAEPAQAGHGVGEVGLVRPPEVLEQVGPQHLGQHALGVGRRQNRRLHRAQGAVDADPRRRADLAVQVRPQQLDEGTEVGLDARFEAHAGGIDRGCARLEVPANHGSRERSPPCGTIDGSGTPPRGGPPEAVNPRDDTHEEQS